MKRLGLVLVFGVLLGTSTCFSAQWAVIVTEFEFQPTELTIQLGDTVTWMNVLGIHNVHEACGTPLFSNSVQEAPWSYSFVFSAANGVVGGAVYPYMCEVHPDVMWGKITVNRPPQLWNVTVANFSFTPQILNVVTGDTIVWTRSAGTHNVHHNVATPKFHNTISGAWTTYVWPCSVGTGSYPYICQVHGAAMSGTVNVTGLPAVPAIPSALVAKSAGEDALLNWNPVAGTTCYILHWSDTPTASPFAHIATVTPDTFFTHFGASALLAKRFYQVTAINN